MLYLDDAEKLDKKGMLQKAVLIKDFRRRVSSIQDERPKVKGISISQPRESAY